MNEILNNVPLFYKSLFYKDYNVYQGEGQVSAIYNYVYVGEDYQRTLIPPKPAKPRTYDQYGNVTGIGNRQIEYIRPVMGY